MAKDGTGAESDKDEKPEDGTTAASGGDGGTGTAESQTGRTFTQEELTAIVAREVRKARDPELERKASEYDRLQSEQQTEQERMAAEAKAKEDAANARIAEANQKLIAADLRIKAHEAGVRTDAIDLVVDRLLTAEEIEVDEKGEVKGTEALVKALVGKHDYLKAPAKDDAPDKSGGAFRGTEGKSIDDQIADAEKAGDYKTARGLKLRKYGSGNKT